MREIIYEIPLNDAFSKSAPCPVCRIYESLESAEVERILGPAMMEPDVRIKTNASGFCSTHLARMRGSQKQLQMALIFESMMDEYLKSGSAAKNTAALARGCYICERVETYAGQMLQNLFTLYARKGQFRERLEKTQGFCLPHFNLLLSMSGEYLKRKESREFAELITGIEREYINEKLSQVKDFISCFDYRSSGSPENPLIVDDMVKILRGF